jgi:hypothetical protein
MSAAVIDRSSRRREARVGKRSHGDAHGRPFVSLFGVEHGRPADRAEPERELGSLVTDANVLGRGAKDLVRGGEAGQRCKDTACSTLAGQAMADSDAAWLSLDFDAQLAAGTGGCSRTHSAPRGRFSSRVGNGGAFPLSTRWWRAPVEPPRRRHDVGRDGPAHPLPAALSRGRAARGNL